MVGRGDRIAERYGMARFKKLATNEWLVYGDVAPIVWPTVSKATQPTAADYGEANIPVGAIWVQSP